MKKYTKNELKEILDKHKLWNKDKTKGKRADLHNTDLRKVDFRKADLEGADLSDSDLRKANLELADLKDADLRGADLRFCNLKNARFSFSNLKKADLRCSKNIETIDLQGASLKGAIMDKKINFIVVR
jgi:uncharacterized protein YjbI with pentapeptide repeats